MKSKSFSKIDLVKPVRRRVSVVVVHDKKILGFHAKDPGTHQKYFFLPGGKIEQGESPENAALRETLEETGYQIRLLPVSPIHTRYDFEWNCSVNDCETIFFSAELWPETQKPLTVDDASYNLGSDWIAVEKAAEVFNYNKEIQSAVLALLAQI